jgi:hypothetical protein
MWSIKQQQTIYSLSLSNLSYNFTSISTDSMNIVAHKLLLLAAKHGTEMTYTFT